ncbi:hypothetical protein ACFLT7_06395 [candidate division KSB1 bacterium]
MGLEALILSAGILGLFVLLLRLSRFQLEVMERFDTLTKVQRNLKMDTMDILYSYREILKGINTIQERQTEVVDMVHQMQSQEDDIETVFQEVFAGMEDAARNRPQDHTSQPQQPSKPPKAEGQPGAE